MRQPTKMPDWMKKQFESAERTVQTWSEGKRKAAGIPSIGSNRAAETEDERMSGWIGVDLDGTLARYDGWVANHNQIGEPVPAMLSRVIDWLDNHQDVRIFTARASASGADLQEQVRLIEEWCLKHIGRKLPITCKKDFGMIKLWDDRCVQVQMNTGAVKPDGWVELCAQQRFEIKKVKE